MERFFAEVLRHRGPPKFPARAVDVLTGVGKRGVFVEVHPEFVAKRLKVPHPGAGFFLALLLALAEFSGDGPAHFAPDVLGLPQNYFEGKGAHHLDYRLEAFNTSAVLRGSLANA